MLKGSYFRSEINKVMNQFVEKCKNIGQNESNQNNFNGDSHLKPVTINSNHDKVLAVSLGTQTYRDILESNKTVQKQSKNVKTQQNIPSYKESNPTTSKSNKSKSGKKSQMDKPNRARTNQEHPPSRKLIIRD